MGPREKQAYVCTAITLVLLLTNASGGHPADGPGTSSGVHRCDVWETQPVCITVI